MLVKTLAKHTNSFGDSFVKLAGDEYDHPYPQLLIKRKKVEAVDVPVRKKRRRRKAK